ncbi:hypothetical protein B0H19DRAFT_65982 [Mycena capillaripes]|nr:hypothetical protein B0H19DRAFT_65982 [Mycena capillaripes]
MDPLTITTSIISLATFIKDLIEVGQSIRRSIEKVGENRRRIRELTNDVLRTLADLADLTRGQEDAFHAPALLTALGHLKAEMLHVHSICEEISPVQRPGFRKIGSQIKVWMKRDDIERKIEHLKAHVNKCYLQFTAFSAARIEQKTARIEQSTARIEDTSLHAVNATLRVEQTLIVNNVEGQVKLRRLEGMMARVLLETQFGQNVLDRTMEIIKSDPNHETLESQYLSVQNTHLLDSIRKIWTSGNLVLEPFWDHPALIQVFVGTTSASDVLYMILGLIRDLHNGGTIKTESTPDFIGLGAHLIELGMASGGLAWHLLKIHILRSLACSPESLIWLANSLKDLSIGYQYQFQYEDSLKASQQSLDLWHHVSESLPEINNRTGLLTAMVIHAKNLLKTSQKADALSVAQDAVALSRPLAEQMIESSSGLSSLTEEDEYEAAMCRKAVFILAETFASLDQHLESYETSKEAFETFLQLPVSARCPHGNRIDSFINQICKLAEGGGFTLAMLADCVILFRNLARMYPEQTSAQFLSLLHAHVYFSQQGNVPDMNPSMENLRIFLEPNSDHPQPALDISFYVALDDIIEDAIWAYYTHPSNTTDLLIRNIFVTHFDEAIVVLREVVENSSTESFTIQWALYSISDILPFVFDSNRATLLQIVKNVIGHFDAILTCRGSDWEWFIYSTLEPIFRYLWGTGLLDDAFAACEQIIKYLQCSNAGDAVVERLREFRINQHFVLFDMGRVSDAIAMIQQTRMADEAAGANVDPSVIQMRVLCRTGRHREALQTFNRGVDGCRRWMADNGEVTDLYLYFLLVERAATWGHVGEPDKALKRAERAVAACRKEVGAQEVHSQKCSLVHSLTTLTNCLAAVGRNDEALVAAQEAVSIYTQNAPHMWDFLYTIRNQELGANAFHSLSLQLTTSGDLDQALINAEKATELYRKLVGLAPRHLPTLASSLRNLASVLSKVGRKDEAVTACVEVVGIMRKVVDLEAYFLPAFADALDQLAAYLTERGNGEGASAVTAESAEVRRKFVSLPPQPEFLFEKVEMDAGLDDEEDEGAEECWETASEDDEYHDASEPDAATDVEEVVSEAARAIICKTPSVSMPDTPPLHAGFESSMVAAEDIVIPSAAAIEPVTDALVLPVDATVTSSVPARDEGPRTEAAISVKSPLTEILSTPLEMRLHSTPMDILWWTLLILFGVLFAVPWSRV